VDPCVQARGGYHATVPSKRQGGRVATGCQSAPDTGLTSRLQQEIGPLAPTWAKLVRTIESADKHESVARVDRE